MRERDEYREKYRTLESKYRAALLHLHENPGDRCEHPCIIEPVTAKHPDVCEWLDSEVVDFGCGGSFPIHYCTYHHEFMTDDQAREERS